MVVVMNRSSAPLDAAPGWFVATDGAGARDVVFVHGFQNDHRAWEPLLGALDGRRHRFLRLDLPGCGASAPPADWRDSTIARLAAELHRHLLAWGADRPVLVGHSLGAAVALQLALDRPGTPAGLVLFAPASTRGLDFVSDEQFATLVHPRPDQQRALLAAAFHRPPDEATIARFEAMVRAAHPAHIEGAARSMRTFDVSDRLTAITAPVLLVAGDRDRHVPLRNHLATWRALPRCGLHVLHRVGHVPFWEDAPTCTRLLAEFIDDELPDRVS